MSAIVIVAVMLLILVPLFVCASIIARLSERGSAPVPSDFPYVVSNELHEVEGLSDAFVTVRSYEPFEGDSRHPDDAPRERVETRYVVENGAARVIGRTWRRYTRMVRGGLGSAARRPAPTTSTTPRRKFGSPTSAPTAPTA